MGGFKIRKYFEIEKKPVRGLLPVEWATLAYLLFTLAIIFFTQTKAVNPEAMVKGRLNILAITIALWIVYRLVPCRATRFMRVFMQMLMLAWWYPDTYEINRILPNLDHYFASWEQQLFGFQPALVFAAKFPSPIISELMDMGYFMYYPMIVCTALFYFFCREREFERCAFIIMASFFAYYVIFDLVPVVGPTFYYKAVGIDNIAHGLFPPLGDYFNTHQDCLVSPGYKDGIFYNLVEAAKATGERPTAAFPSSHVGISTVCMLLALHSRSRRLVVAMLPFYVFLCMATVYIQAHYLIDAIAGFVTAVAFYSVLLIISRKMSNFALSKRRLK